MSAELSEDIKVQKKVGGNVVDGLGFDIGAFYEVLDVISIKNTIPTPNLIPDDYSFYYKFEDNLNDESGTYNATPIGTIGYGLGIQGNALTTTLGNNSIVSGAFDYQTLTMSFWWKFTLNETYYYCGEDNSSTSNSNASGIYGLYDGGNDKIFFRTSDGTLDNFGETEMLDIGSLYSDGDWLHIVFTSDNSTKQNKLFVDSVIKDTVTRPNSIRYTAYTGRSSNFMIGSTYYTGNSKDGTLDEFLYYPRILTDDEILNIYNTQKG